MHFRREWLSLEEIGYRAVTAALSDIAAMAARPRGVLVAIAAPPAAREEILAIGTGIGEAVKTARTTIVGGNLSQADAFSITTTALGSAFAPLTRAGARPGDFIHVTGALGGPSAALKSFASGIPPRTNVRERFARPAARIAEARWLAMHGAVAAVDISDGLGADAGHLAAASGCSVVLEAERLPIVEGGSFEDAWGGEEYELLVASRTPFPTQEFSARFGVPLTLIGRCAEGQGGVKMKQAGKTVDLPESAWVHFER